MSSVGTALEFFSAHKRGIRHYAKVKGTMPLRENYVLLEPQQGRSYSGNIFYIARYLATAQEFSHFQLFYVSYQEVVQETKGFLASNGLSNIKVVELHSKEYARLLASAKYLITDTAFPPYYVKQSGQIIWNTWHGTPLKTLGRSDKSELHMLGNVQKNLAIADYVSHPNEYTQQHIHADFMLGNLFNGTYVLCGYPRVDGLISRSDRARKALNNAGLASKRLYAYLPTYRPVDEEDERQVAQASTKLMGRLKRLNSALEQDEVLLLNLHPMENSRVDYSQLDKIYPFPGEAELYEVLAYAEGLLTDYSSAMFDFAATGKTTVLFAYDKENYLSSRGMYFNYDELPFVQVKDERAAIEQLRIASSFSDKEFLQRFCPADKGNSTELLCKTILLGKDCGLQCSKNVPNGKENVLIYAGNLAKNGITSSLFSLLNSIDTLKRNYFITFTGAHVEENKDQLLRLPENIAFIPMRGKANFNLRQKAIQYLYQERKVGFDVFDRNLAQAYSRDLARAFGIAKFSTVIQFNGYDFKKIYQFSKFETNRVIYVHNDMQREISSKNSQRLEMLRYAYSEYDKVAVVSRDIMASTTEISGRTDNLRHVPNLFDYQRVLRLADEPIAFDENTVSNVGEEKLQQLLNAQGKTIMTIGRYSAEKQHKELLTAFEEVWEKDHTLSLVIVGGSTLKDIYEETLAYARTLECYEAVALVKQLSNPYAVLKQADGFILPSSYEGFGLVLLEADVLGKPVVATEVPGPTGFMHECGGYLVPNTHKGIMDGLEALLDGRATRLNVDYKEYNKKALEAFEGLLS